MKVKMLLILADISLTSLRLVNSVHDNKTK